MLQRTREPLIRGFAKNSRALSRAGYLSQLSHFSFEEIDQLDDQDDYDHQLQDEGAALVELLDHETVEVFGGVELFLDQIFVVGYADFLGAQLVKPRGEHVAQELDGIVGTLGEFVHV